MTHYRGYSQLDILLDEEASHTQGTHSIETTVCRTSLLSAQFVIFEHEACNLVFDYRYKEVPCICIWIYCPGCPVGSVYVYGGAAPSLDYPLGFETSNKVIA